MKKSRTAEAVLPGRLLCAVARATARWGNLALVVVTLPLPLLLLAAWFDPGRSERRQARQEIRHLAKQQHESKLAAQIPPREKDGILELNFNALDFMPLIRGTDPITGSIAFAPHAPERIRNLDDRRVRITGYPLLTRLEGGRGQDLLILASPTQCCYGLPPRFCQFVLAHIDAGIDLPALHRPLSFEGQFRVEDVYVGDAWVALYSLDCSAVTTAPLD